MTKTAAKIWRLYAVVARDETIRNRIKQEAKNEKKEKNNAQIVNL